jgi:hypothetical protein
VPCPGPEPAPSTSNLTIAPSRADEAGVYACRIDVITDDYSALTSGTSAAFISLRRLRRLVIISACELSSKQLAAMMAYGVLLARGISG